MKTGKETTYILLERHSEDVALLREIKLLRNMDQSEFSVFAKKYPTIVALMQGLINETSRES